MAKDPKDEEWRRFDGREVARIEFEVTGGGNYETDLVVSDEDEVQILVTAKVVNVKHPLVAGQVIRRQTCNVTDATIAKVLRRYEPPPQLPLEEGSGSVTPITKGK